MSQFSETSELFANCDEEVTTTCKKLQQILNTIDTREDKTNSLKEALDYIESVNENLKQMEIELEGMGKHKANYKEQYQQQKIKFEGIKKIYNQMKSNYENQMGKESLFGKDHQREKLLKQQEKLYDQNIKLQEAKMIGYGIEKDANQIQLNLKRNNEIIDSNIEKQQYIRNDLSDSFSLIKIMQNRIRNNKLVLFIVGGIMLIALLITIYMHI